MHTPVPEGPWNWWAPRTHQAVLPRSPWLRLGDAQGILIYLHPPTLGTRTPGWPWTAADLTDTLTSPPAKLCHLCIHLCPCFLALPVSCPPLSRSLFFSLWIFILSLPLGLCPLPPPGLYPLPLRFLAPYLRACPSFSVYLPPSPTFPSLPLSRSLHPVLGNKCRPRSSHVLGQGLGTWGK